MLEGRFRRPAIGNRRLRQLLLLAGALLASGLALAGYETHALRQLELLTVDARFQVRGQQPAPRDVAVVAIDTPSIQRLGQWPFRRSLHGRVIDALKRDGARAIAFDVQFTEASRPAEDQALYDAVARAGNVVLGTTEVGPHGSTNVLGGDANLQAAHARAGSANYPVDRGAVFRQLPYQVEGLRSFAVQAAEVGSGRPVARSLFPHGLAWIDYAGGAGRVLTVPYWEVLEHRVPAGTFRGRVVVVGATTPSLQDIHGTPTSNAMPGPEIQANAIHTLLHRAPLRTGPGWIDIALIVLLAIAPVALFLALPFVPAALASVGVGVLEAGGTLVAFEHGRIVAVVAPLVALVLSTVGAMAVYYFTEVRERLRTRDAFRRFIPADVVDQVLAQADGELRLGGIDAEGTVMFSDVRGFTTFSETHDPARVIDVLNHYLSEMTEAILGHGGTLVSYMGDGIMAVFGAPLAQVDHADRALAAAAEMLGPRLTRFNEWAREQGISEGFQMGVGLNSGSFMAGNVGSLQRLEYTVIGDTTNTAARLEGMTKGTGHSLFVADSTRSLLSGTGPELRFVDEFEVRGRRAKIRIWGLAGALADLDAEPRVPPPASGHRERAGDRTPVAAGAGTAPGSTGAKGGLTLDLPGALPANANLAGIQPGSAAHADSTAAAPAVVSPSVTPVVPDGDATAPGGLSARPDGEPVPAPEPAVANANLAGAPERAPAAADPAGEEPAGASAPLGANGDATTAGELFVALLPAESPVGAGSSAVQGSLPAEAGGESLTRDAQPTGG